MAGVGLIVSEWVGTNSGSGIGLHVFVTHDYLVGATARYCLGEKLSDETWPGFSRVCGSLAGKRWRLFPVSGTARTSSRAVAAERSVIVLFPLVPDGQDGDDIVGLDPVQRHVTA